MCLICVEFQKGTLTAQEARAAYSELVNTGEVSDDHEKELEKLLKATETKPV